MNHQERSNASPVSEQRMTAAQAAYLETLCHEAGEPFDPNISAVEASKRIAALQQKTGRKPSVILADGQTDG